MSNEYDRKNIIEQIEGRDLFSNVDAVLDFLLKHINKGVLISGKAQRTERWDYPMDALREIVINMIVHRDYTSSSEAVIKIFDDQPLYFREIFFEIDKSTDII